MKWICCKEQKPGEETPVLCWITREDYPQVMKMQKYKDMEVRPDYNPDLDNALGWVSLWSEHDYYEFEDVTHWMPLPEPPSSRG